MTQVHSGPNIDKSKPPSYSRAHTARKVLLNSLFLGCVFNFKFDTPLPNFHGEKYHIDTLYIYL